MKFSAVFSFNYFECKYFIDQCRIDTKPMSNMRKRVLQDSEVHIKGNAHYDVLIVTENVSKDQVSDIVSGTLTKTYSCTEGAAKMHNYECVLEAMGNNTESRGYLFLGRKEANRMQQIKQILRNDRIIIWKDNNNDSTERQFHSGFRRKGWLSVNQKNMCRNFIRELVSLHYHFRVHEMQSKGSWERPWNTDVVLNALLWNGKGTLVCFREHAGTFYVPGKHRESFLGLAEIFSKLRIDDGIAIPTILRSLDLESTFLKI